MSLADVNAKHVSSVGFELFFNPLNHIKPLPFQQTCPFDLYLQSQYRHEDFRPSASQLLDLPANKSANFRAPLDVHTRKHLEYRLNKLLEISINQVHHCQRQFFCGLKPVSLPSINLIEMAFSINSLLNSGFQPMATYYVEALRGMNGKGRLLQLPPHACCPTMSILKNTSEHQN